jgi:hypothetical protein
MVDKTQHKETDFHALTTASQVVVFIALFVDFTAV